jgi:predicted DsbA family dithiol-disulfide isomerase
MASINVTVFNDPGCPWGYSAIPALRTIEWRYGDQLDWRLVLIGLTESAQQYVDRGYTPLRSAQGLVGFRRFGMPLSPEPRERISATAPACRLVAAAREHAPGSEWRVLRALQLAHFTTPMVLEDVDQLRAALAAVDGVDADALVAAMHAEAVTASYEADRVESRTAAGTAGALQDKTANSDGAERYTAPSVRFERGDARLEATGFQPIAAYDVLVANLDPTLARRGPAGTALEVLEGLAGSVHGDDVTTAEVAAIMTTGNDEPDPDAAERELLALVADGRARRVTLGDGATWQLA